jgi:hypothetical protein
MFAPSNVLDLFANKFAGRRGWTLTRSKVFLGSLDRSFLWHGVSVACQWEKWAPSSMRQGSAGQR